MGDRRLGPYRLVAEIGAGGMGSVHRAVLETDLPGLPAGTTLAVKVVHPHLAAQPTLLARFRREADAGARVIDEHVVRTYRTDDVETPEGVQHLLVMEHVEGQTLRGLLEEMGRVPEALCRHVGREAAHGLAAIHRAGIVHRDVKPENILITRDHRVKVMDLGVAQVAWDAARLSQTGAFVGSLPYAAPEQLRGLPTADGRVDLYALGIVLYELSTGRHPHAAAEMAAVLHSVLAGTKRRCGELCPDLSPFFEALVHRLIAVDADERIGSAEELARILDQGESSAWWGLERARDAAAGRARRRAPRTPCETSMHGRATELRALRQAFDRARGGDGNAVLVDGEAGIGKTRLVDEFLAALDRDGEAATTLLGSCAAGVTGAGVLVDACRDLFGEAGVADRLRPYLATSPRLVPSFAAMVEGRPAPADAPRLDTGALVTVCGHLLRGLAREQPTVVVLEDLHLATPEDRALFTGLAASLPAARLLLLATSRTTQGEAWPADLLSLPHVARLPLGRLGAQDLVHLLEEAFRSERLAAELSGKIARKSDGNPWFTFEILRGLREGRRIVTRPDGTWTTVGGLEEIEVPATVRDAVSGRLRDLDDDLRAWLEMAACGGFEFDPSAVSAALGLPRLAGLRTCARIERDRGLVRGAGRLYAFDHHQVQEILYAGLHPQMREACHVALGDAIERLSGTGGGATFGGGSGGGTGGGGSLGAGTPSEPDGSVCVEMCRHFLLGGVPERAAPYLRPAITWLQETVRHDDAWRLGCQALDAPRFLEGAARVETILALAGDDGRVCPPIEAIARLEDAASRAQSLGRPDLVAKAGAALATFWTRTGRYDTAEARIPGLLDAARTARDAESEVRLTGHLGHAAHGRGRMPEARVRYEAQREVAERHGLAALEGHALANLSVLAFRQGAYEEALTLARKARGRLRDAGSRLTAARVACSEADAALFLGRLGEAYGIYEDAIAEFRAQGQRWDEAFTLSFHAWLLSHLGETDRALECVRRGHEIAAAPDARDLIPVLLMREAEIRFLLGDLERAKALAGEAQAGMQGTPRPDDPVWPLTLLGLVEERRGRPAEARDRFREAIALHPDPATGALRASLECYAACVGGASSADAAAMLREHGHRLACGDHMTASFALWRATGDRAWLQAARADLDTWVTHAPPQFREAMRTRVRPHVDILQA